MLWGQSAGPPAGLRRRRRPEPAPQERNEPLPLEDDEGTSPAHVAELLRRAAVPARWRPRLGAVVGDTVENWARRAARERSTRPLVFGGTYPIDEPEDSAPSFHQVERRRRLRDTVERSVRRFEAALASRAGGRSLVRTFDIDEPLGPREERPAPDPDSRVYLAGPQTYDIDEPVTFM